MSEKNNSNGIVSQEEVKKILANLGNLVRTYRQKKGWSMALLAEKSGISSSLISDLENNKGKIPNIFTLVSIGRALELPDDVFIKGFWKDVAPNRKHVDNETIIREALLKYNIPEEVVSNIMKQVNILSCLGDMYDLSSTKGTDTEDFKKKQDKLLNLYLQYGIKQ